MLDVLNQIAYDVVVLGGRLARGAALPKEKDPIYCTDIAALFERVAADGTKSYLTFHYTQDLKTLDPNAQVHLSQFFGRIVAVNGLLAQHTLGQAPTKRPIIAAMLDQILLEALFFTGFFYAYALSRDLLLNRIPAGVGGEQFATLIAQSRADFIAATPYLHDANTALAALTMTTQQLIVEQAKPYEAGQRQINNVYFDAGMAAQTLAVGANS